MTRLSAAWLAVSLLGACAGAPAPRAAVREAPCLSNERALRLTWSRCRDDDTASCASLARAWLGTRSLPFDVDLERVFAGGCAEHVSWSCRRLATLRLEDRRPAEAAAPARRGCELADVAACGMAGELVLTGASSRAEAADGVRMLELACSGGVIGACAQLEAGAAAAHALGDP